MDAERFDNLARSLLTASTRRGVFAGLASGLLAFFPLLRGGDEVEGKKKRKKKKHKKKRPACTPNCVDKACGADGCGSACGTCGSCAACQGNSCVPKLDDTTCGGDGKCQNGACNSLPTCVRYANNCGLDSSSCCGAPCPGGGGAGELCGPSGFDDPCVVDDDCSSNDCVGYRCRKGGFGANCLFNEDCLSNYCNHLTGSKCE